MHIHTMWRSLACALFAVTLPAQVQYFSATLDGAQEVPPVPTTGGGYGIVRLDTATNSVRIFVHHFGLSGAPSAAHLHQGAIGVNGGVIVPLAAAGSDTFTGGAALTPAQAAAVTGGGTYLNVHTAAFPGGEIRGQVVTATSTRFTAQLSGAQEVPPTPSAATGTAIAFLHEPDNRLVYTVESTGLAAATAAHLHNGAVGINGGVVFPLQGSGGNYCGVSPRLSATQVATLLADGTYFNIHTPAFPGGEVRGQLRKDLGDHFAAALDGSQEVPANAAVGRGAAALELDAAGTATITVNFGGLTGAPSAAHIHAAAVGVNGPVVVPLVLSGSQFVATFVPTVPQLTQLRSAGWYVNVHTAAFPGGEIRGQLLPASLPAPFGPSCPGSSGARPQIGASSFARLGGPVDIELFGAAPSTGCFLIHGFDRDQAGALPLPVAFAAVGLVAPCFFLVDPVATSLVFSDPRGCASRTWNVPFLPPLLGFAVHTQWVVLDAGANPAGLVASNAQTFVLQ